MKVEKLVRDKKIMFVIKIKQNLQSVKHDT